MEGPSRPRSADGVLPVRGRLFGLAPRLVKVHHVLGDLARGKTVGASVRSERLVGLDEQGLGRREVALLHE